MNKYIRAAVMGSVMLAANLFPVHAQETNVQLHPNGALTAPSINVQPLIDAQGLDPTTPIQNLPYKLTLGDVAIWAANSAQRTDFVNSSGSLSLPLDTVTGIIGNDAFGNYLTSEFSGGYDPFRGYEADLLGGWKTYPDGTYGTRQLLVQTDPYGPYSAGCGVAVNVGAGYTAQSPVSEAPPYVGAASVVAVGAYDTVANCTLAGNTPARYVLTATGYTATTVELATPVTASMAARILPNMYITTNSPNPNLHPTSVDGELPARNLYAGFISQRPVVGETVLHVYAWDVPGIGTKAAGQVPQTSQLDTVWSGYSQPTVWVGGGAASSMFGHNWFFGLNAQDLIPNGTTRSLIHQITPIEIDLNIANGTAPAHSVDWQGISMNAGNQPAALTTDSRQILLGGNINHHLQFDGGEGNWVIDGDNMYTPSLKNQSLSTAHPDQLMQGWQGWVDGSNRLQFALWSHIGNTSVSTGWMRAVLHLGPMIDGNFAPETAPGGSYQADLQWNRNQNYGGLDICGYTTNCGFHLEGGGQVDLDMNARISGTAYLRGSIVGQTSSGANLGQLGWDANGNLTLTNSPSGGGGFKIPADLSAAGYTSNGGSFDDTTFLTGGQGYHIAWNQIEAGKALTEFTNIDPTSAGGFIWRNAPTGGKVDPSQYLIKTNAGGTFINTDLNITNGHVAWLPPAHLDNNLQAGFCAPSSYYLATCSNIGAAISLRISGDFISSNGTNSNNWSSAGNLSDFHPDGHGNWTTVAATAGGGSLAIAGYTMATLPTSNEADGAQLYCTDCVLNSVVGAQVIWHSSASKWTTFDNADLKNTQ